jgi:dolichol-phosphate mannosyltransferase
MNNQISVALIIPSYNETLALPGLLCELKEGLTERDAVIIMDDSQPIIFEEIKRKCLIATQGSKFFLMFDNSGSKSGRGAAVRRGMEVALTQFPIVEKILECDADGSHRSVDILKLKNSESTSDLLVGSRYLSSSKIVGWPLGRRIFSWLLNQSIPKLTRVNLHDITNGLRRYSKKAVIKVLSEKQKNKGFIYLSEQAILISRAGMVLSEEPIVFIDRTLGKSTVTWREISGSLYGIFRLVLSNLKP